MEDKKRFQISFRDQNFLVSEGLSFDNILDYFYESPFYSASVSQERFVANELIRRGRCETLSEALNMLGSEESVTGIIEWFEVSYMNEEAKKGFVDESIFVIQRFERTQTAKRTPKEVLYVLSGTIYASPSVGILLERSLGVSVSCLNTIIDEGKNLHEKLIAKTQPRITKDSLWPDFVEFPEDAGSIESLNHATVAIRELQNRYS